MWENLQIESNMRTFRVVALVSCGLLVAIPAHADDCVALGDARLFASESGGHAFRLSGKPGKLPEGTLVAIRNDFRERRIWRARLITDPSRVLVPDDGRSVVTIDNGSCGSGREHAVVVYGERGRIVANLRLQDILTEKEIREKVRHTVTGPDWMEKASFSFERLGGALAIKFDWGTYVTVDLPTGRVTGTGG